MAPSEMTSRLFENPNEAEREIQLFVDGKFADGLDLAEVEDALAGEYADMPVLYYGKAYATWKSAAGRTDAPDGSDDEFSGKELDELLESFLRELDEDDGSPEEGEDAPGSGGTGDGPEIGFAWEVDEFRFEHRVEGRLPGNIVPRKGTYVHADLILPEGYRAGGTLHLVMRTSKSARPVEAWFDNAAVSLFRERGRLHLRPVSNDRLFGDGMVYVAGDFLDIRLFEDDRLLWERFAFVTSEDADAAAEPEALPEVEDDPLRDIRRLVGCDGFKDRMELLAQRADVSRRRARMGMDALPPNLHTVIVGNPGTGKNTAAGLMARLLVSLGLLRSKEMKVIRLSEVASSSYNGEYDEVMGAVRSADAEHGVLVFDNAHELYKVDGKDGYNSEQRIVRALADAMDDREKFGHWALLLLGEPEGLESLLGSNPDLARHFAPPIYLEDFTPEQLRELAGRVAEGMSLEMSADAASRLQTYILHKYKRRGPGFQNARLVRRLFEEEIVPAMSRRLSGIPEPAGIQLRTVEAEDIPAIRTPADASGMAALEGLVGLEKIKGRVRDYLNAVRLAGRRMELGLPTGMPRLHMAFLGNPGTGKTTVAEIIGKVFASWGILSCGRVIRTEKSQLVGQYVGDTEHRMRHLLARARGNILFIDEAYQLVEGGEKDYGRIVMDSLLTELGKDNPDMVVILAGYTAPMRKLLESNEGIESRFPNVFHFEDYTTGELLEIGRQMIRRQGFVLTDGAAANMRAILEEEAESPSQRFGNGRFVANLLQNEILANLGGRTAAIASPTREQLSTILPEDVVVGKARRDAVFDDAAIDEALGRLDALAGLSGVKKALHDFVRSARYLHSTGEPYVGKGLPVWRFVGRSGTGKSTVAEIMACILKGMRLISNSHITEVKGERIFNASEADCDAVLRDAVRKSCNGLVFLDMDDLRLAGSTLSYGRSVEQIRLKVKELAGEVGGECALVMAELEAPNGNVAEQLSRSGIHEFDHTLIFKDFTADELYEILCLCLGKFGISFSPAAESHMRDYLRSMNATAPAGARTMKLMSRTIRQQVVLRESGLGGRPSEHKVQLSDIGAFRWNASRGRIGF